MDYVYEKNEKKKKKKKGTNETINLWPALLDRNK